VRKLAAAVLLVLTLALPAYAQTGNNEITKDDLDAAAQVRRQAAAELFDATALYEENVSQAEELADTLTKLGVQLAVLEQQLGIARDTARGVAKELYMAAGSTGVVLLLDSSSISDISLRRSYFDLASATDIAALTYLQAIEANYSESSVLLAQADEEQTVLTGQAEELAGLILRRLDEAEIEYRALVSEYQAQEAEKARLAELERQRRAEEERRRRAAERAAAKAAAAAAATTTTSTPNSNPSPTSSTTSPPTSDAPAVTTSTTAPPSPPVDGQVCPVDGPTSFVDSFGARRSGGRSHEGVDMISKRGTPLVAIEAGTVKRMRNGGLGGITVWLRGEEGDEFYYAHLDAWADGLSVGDRVGAGQLLGYVGSTGNASYKLPHLHFQYHPGGGRAVNPYPLVAGLCL